MTDDIFQTMARGALFFTVVVLLVSIASGQNGISNYRELNSHKEELLRVNTQLSAQNQLLFQEMESLKSSRDSQIRYLKSIGFVEEGERVYVFNTPEVQIEGKADQTTNKPAPTKKNSAHGKSVHSAPKKRH